MGGEISSDLCSVKKSRLPDQRKNEVVEISDHSATISNGHAGSILFQGNVSSITRPCLNPPMSAANLQKPRGIWFFARDACNSKFDRTRSSMTCTAAPSLVFPFQPIGLCQARADRRGIEHFTGSQHECFDPPP